MEAYTDELVLLNGGSTELHLDGRRTTVYYWFNPETGGVLNHTGINENEADPFFGSIGEAETFPQQQAGQDETDSYSKLSLYSAKIRKAEDAVDVPDKYVYRWVHRAADRLQEMTGDEGWQFVGPHGLRRTWGIHLLEQGVLPSVVMAFGGWDDWETFRRHYLGEFSPEAIRRECAKIDFLGGEPETGHPQIGTMPQTRTQFSEQ